MRSHDKSTARKVYSIYVRIEETTINPTAEQALACVRVCQWLSNCYLDIHLFRFNDQEGYLFILAGDDLQIIVFPSGNWRFE
ncbi:hypothetical protein OGM63_10875 [Plectonema radiosum NIES-515]|uniref:DUF6888 domain-containing protein n=1 Tax=Plectonema radiosum NIES-515 TaxID=2986073 RepID=A0ABT3AY34_9CYAN|nr:hypothetical protein [Plectonema radiosum]MCV3214011.1 hypothetical protein [Plectonema radiosum NIES-515]